MRRGNANGYGSALESAQAETELKATAQILPQLQSAIARQERALDVLLARPPGTVARNATLEGLHSRGLPSAGIPSALLRRRADIAQAEWQIVAADARLAAARSRMPPSVRLNAAFGSAGSSVLRGDPFTLWNVGGSVLAPLFDAGRWRSSAEVSASQRNQAVQAYQRTVPTAFAEVEVSLTVHASSQAQLGALEAQRTALTEALRIASRRHRDGHWSYLDELLAQRNLFGVAQQLQQQRAALLQSELQIRRALGGGWSR